MQSKAEKVTQRSYFFIITPDHKIWEGHFYTERESAQARLDDQIGYIQKDIQMHKKFISENPIQSQVPGIRNVAALRQCEKYLKRVQSFYIKEMVV